MPIKSFRGLLKNGTQDTVVLHTNTGSTGYRIKKFQIMLQDDVLIMTLLYVLSLPK